MRRHDIAIFGLLFLLPLVMFSQQTVGGKTLIPTENLYQYEPFATYREVIRAPEYPHNHLLSDLVLQNYPWKSFIQEQFAQGEIPLWNPHTFSGTSFMAAGQQSTLYPLSILYYIMPLTAAYGWFTVVSLWLAGVFMYLFARGLERSRFAATIAAITYQLCGMFIASAVHPMIIGGVVWMPLMLLMAEYIIRQRPLFGVAVSAPWMAIGALAIACNILAGHAEITIYSLLILAYYSGLRLVYELWRTRNLLHVLRRGGWITALVVLGLGLGAVQLIPLYDFVQTNWRAERDSLDTVLDYAHQWRDLLQYLVPNFYGSPAHHTYFDVFTGQNVQIGFVNAIREFRTHTDWGMKNYVEAALYVGILPLVLAGFAVGMAIIKTFQRAQYIAPLQPRQSSPYILIFALLTVISLTFMFGMRTYAVIYVLPGINQLNTAFRWVYGVTIGIAVLAAFGADALMQYRTAARRVGYGLVGVGVLTLVGLLLSRVFYGQVEPLIERLLNSLAKANEGFDSPQTFYSYQFVNFLIFGLVAIGAGIACLWTRDTGEKVTLPKVFTVGLVAADLLIASWGFNAASDPYLLDFTPPAIEWLQNQPGHFRYMVVNGNGREILPANMTLRYGLDDVTGYDSIISKQYVDYMQNIASQDGALMYNRISALFVSDQINNILRSPRFQQLNVRYIVTHKDTTFDDAVSATLVHQDEAVNIWEIPTLPRAYTVDAPEEIGNAAPVEIIGDSGRELLLNLENTDATWLVVSQTYAPGWKAFIRPQGVGEDAETELTVERVQENFQGVYLPESGEWTVRLIYSPTSFQVGVFGTIISAAIIVLVVGTWAWRLFIAPKSDQEGSGASRLARNSIAPILLNLFNRSIDLVFAAVMFRILGPERAGYYYLAIAIFGWFDIISNFGLDVYLMREAGRSRGRAGYFFANTSALRFSLVLGCIPLLVAFLAIRQASAEPLNIDVLLTIALFYVGLVPGTISKGLTSLFYAFEKAEYPAVITTITTICRITFGLMALLLGYGFVGLAAVSVITNLITLVVLLLAERPMIGQVRQLQKTIQASPRLNLSLIRNMGGQSFPLMLNHLLATIFFQIDIVILEWVRDARTVGLYRVAYSWLLAINIIPAFFTQALMPIMSRQWQSDKPALKRTYTLSIKLLTSIAFPMAVIFTFLAEPLTTILAGSAYLPDGAIALQIMIWSIPIGWMNSLTQYALIAVDLQRRITLAFIAAVFFNITTNLILIPRFGYQAAALTTIASEGVLFVAFALLMQSALGRLAWLDMLWRQAAAAGVMSAVMVGLWTIQPLLGLAVGCIVYPVMLMALRPLDDEELAFVLPHLPGRVQAIFATT
jgi:O-antigen/teichoic acid export membrane protein